VNTLKKVNECGVKHYWIGAGTTDFLLSGAKTLLRGRAESSGDGVSLALTNYFFSGHDLT
jgi:hypothetical protein